MFYYQELTLIEQVEISAYFIWSKLYTQLHLAFVEIKGEDNTIDIGVSFPEYVYNKGEGIISEVNLGNKLRIFALSQDKLQNLQLDKWLERIKDYVHISQISSVPEQRITAYASFQKKQFKTNAERLARRYVKRHPGIELTDKLITAYKNSVVSTTDLPFIQMNSLTTKQPYKLFIQKNIGQKSNEHKFSTFGLSSTSSVPEF